MNTEDDDLAGLDRRHHLGRPVAPNPPSVSDQSLRHTRHRGRFPYTQGAMVCNFADHAKRLFFLRFYMPTF